MVSSEYVDLMDIGSTRLIDSIEMCYSKPEQNSHTRSMASLLRYPLDDKLVNIDKSDVTDNMCVWDEKHTGINGDDGWKNYCVKENSTIEEKGIIIKEKYDGDGDNSKKCYNTNDIGVNYQEHFNIADEKSKQCDIICSSKHNLNISSNDDKTTIWNSDAFNLDYNNSCFEVNDMGIKNSDCSISNHSSLCNNTEQYTNGYTYDNDINLDKRLRPLSFVNNSINNGKEVIKEIENSNKKIDTDNNSELDPYTVIDINNKTLFHELDTFTDITTFTKTNNFEQNNIVQLINSSIQCNADIPNIPINYNYPSIEEDNLFTTNSGISDIFSSNNIPPNPNNSFNINSSYNSDSTSNISCSSNANGTTSIELTPYPLSSDNFTPNISITSNQGNCSKFNYVDLTNISNNDYLSNSLKNEYYNSNMATLKSNQNDVNRNNASSSVNHYTSNPIQIPIEQNCIHSNTKSIAQYECEPSIYSHTNSTHISPNVPQFHSSHTHITPYMPHYYAGQANTTRIQPKHFIPKLVSSHGSIHKKISPSSSRRKRALTRHSSSMSSLQNGDLLSGAKLFRPVVAYEPRRSRCDLDIDDTILTPVTLRPRRTHVGCSTIKYNRTNYASSSSSELQGSEIICDASRTYFCDFEGK